MQLKLLPLSKRAAAFVFAKEEKRQSSRRYAGGFASFFCGRGHGPFCRITAGGGAMEARGMIARTGYALAASPSVGIVVALDDGGDLAVCLLHFLAESAGRHPQRAVPQDDELFHPI